jgi:hypothetical protein
MSYQLLVVIGPWHEIVTFVEKHHSLCLKEISPIIIINSAVPDDQFWKRICWLPQIFVYTVNKRIF